MSHCADSFLSCLRLIRRPIVYCAVSVVIITVLCIPFFVIILIVIDLLLISRIQSHLLFRSQGS